jgi:hypothetical protein
MVTARMQCNPANPGTATGTLTLLLNNAVDGYGTTYGATGLGTLPLGTCTSTLATSTLTVIEQGNYQLGYKTTGSITGSYNYDIYFSVTRIQ